MTCSAATFCSAERWKIAERLIASRHHSPGGERGRVVDHEEHLEDFLDDTCFGSKVSWTTSRGRFARADLLVAGVLPSSPM